MTHPYYRLSSSQNRSAWFWSLACIITVVALIIPWLLPAKTASAQPWKYLKSVLTFPLELEWEHIYRYQPEDSVPNFETSNNLQQTQNNEIHLSQSHFPLKIGNKWVYENIRTGSVMNPDQKTVSSKTIEIIDSIESRNLTIYKAQITDNGSISYAHYFWDADGLKRTPDPERPYRQPILILKNNPDIGDSWYESPAGGAINTVIREESVSVPSGQFNCILVEYQFSASADARHLTWYAKGVGIINQRQGSSVKGINEWKLIDFSHN